MQADVISHVERTRPGRIAGAEIVIDILLRQARISHGDALHIQRLMVTGNFALLAEVEPRQVSDWYLAVYVDAVESVELPNTASMALYANGGALQRLSALDAL